MKSPYAGGVSFDLTGDGKTRENLKYLSVCQNNIYTLWFKNSWHPGGYANLHTTDCEGKIVLLVVNAITFLLSKAAA